MMLLELTSGLLSLYTALSPVRVPQLAVSTVPVSESTPIVAAADVDVLDREALELYVRTYFKNTPILAEIAKCESTFRHETLDGSVLRGLANPKDVGLMQINEHYHEDTARSLGIDLHTLEGNLAYAEVLYRKFGVRPWKASSGCWKKTEAYQELVSGEIAKI